MNNCNNIFILYFYLIFFFFYVLCYQIKAQWLLLEEEFYRSKYLINALLKVIDILQGFQAILTIFFIDFIPVIDFDMRDRNV